MLRVTGRVAAYVVLFGAGVLVGAAGAFVQAVTVRVGPVSLPVGVVLALTGTTGLFYAGGRLMGGRAGAVVPAVAWLLTVMLLSNKRPEGDVVLSQAASAYVYLFLGTLIGAVVATLAGVHLRPAATSAAAPGG